MSTNPYYRFMLNVAGIREKEPFFQRAWGKVNILSRQRDREIHKDLRGSNFELQNSHNKSVLNSFNSNTMQHEHASMLEELANETLIFIEEQREQAKKRAKEDSLKNNAIHAYISKIVETLSPYAGLVNTVVGHTELYTVLTGPETIVEQIKMPGAHDNFEYRKDFRARFSTRTWSLLFRGIEGRIDIFLLPVDKVMRLTKVESFYKPVARIFAEVQGTKVHWILEGEDMNAEQRMAFILKLFHQLLDRTKAQMFRDHGRNGIPNSDMFELAIAKVQFDEEQGTMDFDYREGQPYLFGPNETANSSSAVEPEYIEEPVAQQEVIDLTDFNQMSPEFNSQYLRLEGDFAVRTQDCTDKYCESAFKTSAKPQITEDKPVKKPAAVAKTSKKPKSKTKGTSKRKR